MKTPLFSLNTYTDDVILSDTRVSMIKEYKDYYHTHDYHRYINQHTLNFDYPLIQIVVENILREKGLLLSGSKSYSKFFDEKSRTPAGNIKCLDTASSYAVQKMLKDLPTPSKPRPDTSSAQVSAAISNPSGILSTVQFKL